MKLTPFEYDYLHGIVEDYINLGFLRRNMEDNSILARQITNLIMNSVETSIEKWEHQLVAKSLLELNVEENRILVLLGGVMVLLGRGMFEFFKFNTQYFDEIRFQRFCDSVINPLVANIKTSN